MKIGILTFHRPANFGANLQAYCSMCYLRSLGYEAKVIDYVRAGDLEYRKQVDAKQYEAHKSFVETRLNLTKQATTSEDLSRIVEEEHFDAIVVGADAVWRSPNDSNIYFAEWLFKSPELSGIPVASISPAHMGDGFTALSDARQEAIKNCLLKFKYITVRDEWTKKVINRDLFNGKEYITRVNPDPVFTMYRNVNDEIWDGRGRKEKAYYLMSLPKDWASGGKFRAKKIRWFANFKACVNMVGYELVELPIPEGRSGMPFDYTVDYPIDPIQWFLWIKNAKAFCGLRFHAIVSAISSGTPFYSMDSYGDNGRISQILDILGLHKIARTRDAKSKIYNLLKGSSFETNRCNALIEFESARKVFNALESTTRDDVVRFRDMNIAIFEDNMAEMLKAISE